MKGMLSSLVAAVLFAGLFAPAAAAEESGLCWWETRTGLRGDPVTVQVCEFNGKLVEEGKPGWVPPDPPLVYDLGYDNDGECYYLRTGPWGGWVVLASSGDRIQFGLDPDGIPGGPIAGDVWVDPCRSRPIPGEPPVRLVWRVVESYPFQDPNPDIVPDEIGLTGAPTKVFVAPPEPLEATVVSRVTGSRIDVEIRAAAVTISWGDGTVTTVPESQFERFRPHPDSDVAHVWDESEFVDLSIAYEWSARWRLNGGTWNYLIIPNNTWSEPYRVDQLVGRRSG